MAENICMFRPSFLDADCHKPEVGERFDPIVVRATKIEKVGRRRRDDLGKKLHCKQQAKASLRARLLTFAFTRRCRAAKRDHVALNSVGSEHRESARVVGHLKQGGGGGVLGCSLLQTCPRASDRSATD